MTISENKRPMKQTIKADVKDLTRTETTKELKYRGE